MLFCAWLLPAAAADPLPPLTPPPTTDYFNREQKVWLLNAGAAATILTWGAVHWDYGQSSFHFENEDWFGRTTKEGGSDKLGHFWSTYALGHLFAHVYQSWDYPSEDAYLYGTLSSLGVQTLMEIGDGFSQRYGSSYEDMVMNGLGAGASYLLGKYPDLASKIDFRVEHTLDFKDASGDIFTDYKNLRWLMAIKADGFESIENPLLRYLELQVGYFARGYENYVEGGSDHRRRTLYVGVGLNVSKLVQNFFDTRFFNYFQAPYTSVRFEDRLDK
jgi:hypothetical protein